MCGRFHLATSPAALAQLFLPPLEEAPEDPAADPRLPPPEALRPRYNIAPTQPICAVLAADATGPRQLTMLRWGLLPGWADDLAVGNRMINARSETVREKPSFRRPFAARRCLIPASGYYEWQQRDSGKQPYRFHRPEDALFAMAGLWETNRRAARAGETIRSCTILTTAANATGRPIHERMPVILPAAAYDRWLDPHAELDEVEALLRPAPDDYLQAEPVSRRVNNPKHEDPDCLQPIDPSTDPS